MEKIRCLFQWYCRKRACLWYLPCHFLESLEAMSYLPYRDRIVNVRTLTGFAESVHYTFSSKSCLGFACPLQVYSKVALTLWISLVRDSCVICPSESNDNGARMQINLIRVKVKCQRPTRLAPSLFRLSVELFHFQLFLDPPFQHSVNGMVEWRIHELP